LITNSELTNHLKANRGNNWQILLEFKVTCLTLSQLKERIDKDTTPTYSNSVAAASNYLLIRTTAFNLLTREETIIFLFKGWKFLKRLKIVGLNQTCHLLSLIKLLKKSFTSQTSIKLILLKKSWRKAWPVWLSQKVRGIWSSSQVSADRKLSCLFQVWYLKANLHLVSLRKQ
jgi:hypothetical protein